MKYTVPIVATLLSVVSWVTPIPANAEGSDPALPSILTQPQPTGIQLVVSIEDRKLHVYENHIHTASYPVAIGKEDHPTPRGELYLTKIDLNPEWVPPASEWAANRTYKRPGHPENPLGLVRMHLDDEYRLHGTLDHWTIGYKVSYGCIRLKNTNALRLARKIAELSDVENYRQYFSQAVAQPFRMVEIDLPEPVLLTVHEQFRHVPQRLFNPDTQGVFTLRKQITAQTIAGRNQ